MTQTEMSSFLTKKLTSGDMSKRGDTCNILQKSIKTLSCHWGESRWVERQETFCISARLSTFEWMEWTSIGTNISGYLKPKYAKDYGVLYYTVLPITLNGHSPQDWLLVEKVDCWTVYYLDSTEVTNSDIYDGIQRLFEELWLLLLFSRSLRWYY
jgi:hypothetical protein